MAHHATAPLPDLLDDGRLRIYFGPRDSQGRTRVGCVEVSADDPTNVQRLYEEPCLDLGALGTFDDSGAMPSGLVRSGNDAYLYYIGWNQRRTVPYSTAIGLAVRSGTGPEFERVYEGPVLERDHQEPYMVTGPFVLLEGGRWRMWYSSGTKWLTVHGRAEPLYLIKHAESDDGVHWRKDSPVCIVPKSPTEANGRPWVVRKGDHYRMWYSYRDVIDFRSDRSRTYRIGYAESSDGLTWTRLDEEGGMEPSHDGSWDSEMVEYAGVYEHAGTTHLLYNGNGFGESGFGHAVLQPG
jgi:predicted GH43/DUF377 family glycosyl hydrolase